MKKQSRAVLVIVFALTAASAFAGKVCPKAASAPTECTEVQAGDCFVDSNNVVRTCNGSGSWLTYVNTTSNQTLNGTNTFGAQPLISGTTIGTPALSTAVEHLSGVHRTVLSIVQSGVSGKVTLADGDHGGGKTIYTFPEGYIYILGATIDLNVANGANFNAHANDTFYFSVGSAAAADDSDLTLTEADIIARATVDTTSGTVTSRDVTGSLTTPVALDGTTTAATLNINYAIGAAANSGANDFTASGDLVILWAHLGDY